MGEDELLIKVKDGLNIYDDSINSTLLIFIKEVKNHMLDGGIPSSFFDDDSCVGIVTIGVRDLYYNGSLSAYFDRRMFQLKYRGE